MSPILWKQSMSIPSNTTANKLVTAAISLGSNLPHGNCTPAQILLCAIERLRELSVESKASSLYLSEPIDCPEGVQDFINAAMVLHLPAATSPEALLRELQRLEADFGRQRGAEQNQARSLDLDIIWFENQELNTPSLILPHPRAAQRRFVLMPLAEIYPELVLTGQSSDIAKLLVELPSGDAVRLLDCQGITN